MDVLCFKLPSGMDVIGRVTQNEGESFARVSRPMTINAFPSPNGIAVSLVPFLMFSRTDPLQQEVELRPEHYILSYVPKEDLVQAYLEQTSGLSLVQTGVNAIKP